MAYKLLTLFILTVFGIISVDAQTYETPKIPIQWKANKSDSFEGFIVLKSGKKMEGTITLKGSESYIKSIQYEGDGKDIDFPTAAIISYGSSAASNPVIAGDIRTTYGSANKSTTPDDFYVWKNNGIVMGDTLYNSDFEPGYVTDMDGKKHTGDVMVKKAGEDVKKIVIKTSEGKETFKIDDVARYGLDKTKEEAKQEKIGATMTNAFEGGVITTYGKEPGMLDLKEEVCKGCVGFTSILLKRPDGSFQEFTPSTATGCEIKIKDEMVNYILIDNRFVQERYNGNVFQFYKKPVSTHINHKATANAKTFMSAGTTVIGAAIVNKDAKDNNYDSNMDSLITHGSLEDLQEMEEVLLALGGHPTYDDAEENPKSSNGDSYYNNLSAVHLAIIGRQASNEMEDIYYTDWILLNKKTKEVLIIYPDNYEGIMEGMLYGCYQYLELDKKDQKDMLKWKNRLESIKYIDNCY